MKHINFINSSYGKVSEHFNAKEFACKDGNREMLICTELLEVLEKVRCYFDSPVIINSGYRTPSHNAKIGGAGNSYHCKGMAADIKVKGHTAKEVAEYAKKILDKGGIIQYNNFVHIDVRETKYRKGV